MNIPENLHTIAQQLRHAEQQFHRPANSVQLLAVSKNQPIEKIQTAYQAGQRAFGENYLQEALIKIANLPNDIEWHFIGSIQSNKTRKIAENFMWVHSVADSKIALRLSEQRPTHLPLLNICLEVNVDQDQNKSGIDLADLEKLALYVNQLPRVKLRGLMTMPRYTENLAEQRESFARLQKCFKQLIAQGLALDTLSMGTSHDYLAAIAEGATWVRLGTSIFGARQSRG